MTTIAAATGLGSDGIRTLEVRWIFSGRLTTAMAQWFGRFPVQAITIEDAYLVDPHLPRLSVKVRERQALEVKMHHGSAGLLEMPGRARGLLESWQKWSFPCGPDDQGGGEPVGWRMVRKRRQISRFSRVGQLAGARVAGPGTRPGCTVELTEFCALGEIWWTLGFEARGPAHLLAGELDAAAALVFNRALPGGVELRLDDSMSYARWLRRAVGRGAERPRQRGSDL